MAETPCQAELRRLRLHSDAIDAINRLGKKHDMLDVLEYLREWVAFMDRAKAVMAAHNDGRDDA